MDRRILTNYTRTKFLYYTIGIDLRGTDHIALALPRELILTQDTSIRVLSELLPQCDDLV